ncbi:MAG: RNA-binding S4 domain-containing protein [Chlorobi bacterium]|nr:RNA-binding S4 domain-containing protein [Chlorobiota bacterium]
MRIDKWLWSVRLFKTRTQASDACKGGKIKIDGSRTKASKEVKIDDVIEVQLHLIKKVVKVLQLPKSRVGAKFVPDLLEDMTPAEEYERNDMIRQLNQEKRDRGEGRPTKKDRRELYKLKRK